MKTVFPALLCMAAAFAADIHPVHEVEPVWGPELQKNYVVDIVKVKMVIEADGTPFALEAASGIPDNVVQALSQWRFAAARSPFAVSLNAPIRRAIGGNAVRRAWRPQSPELEDALKAAAQLTPEQASRLEERLKSEPDAMNSRLTLIAYYAKLQTGDDQVIQSRRAHIAWFVEHDPQRELLSSPLAVINAAADPLRDDAGFQEVRKRWLDQVSRAGGDPVIARGAVNFLRVGDPVAALKIISPMLNHMNEASEWLGDVYGLTALGVTALDLNTGMAANAGAELPRTAAAQQAQKALKTFTDARVLISGLATVTAAGRSLSKAGHLPEGFGPFCDSLLAHVREVDPATSANCDPSSQPPDDSLPQRIRVGGNVESANIIKKVLPQYPAEAKRRRIQGTVRFSVIIARDGTIAHMNFVSGPLALYEAARDAVQQWTYKPTLLNGRPVEVVTQIDVNYVLRQ